MRIHRRSILVRPYGNIDNHVERVRSRANCGCPAQLNTRVLGKMRVPFYR